MNLTELARRLKITPQELRDSLPQLGFDIGQKAIKINPAIAHKILRDWPLLRRRLEALKAGTRADAPVADANIPKKLVNLPALITVREFAQISGVPVNKLLAELMKNGVFASLNEKIDYDTAWLVGSELNLDIQREEHEKEEAPSGTTVQELVAGEKPGSLEPRPPVIVVMGHVDHGKTKLLDSIRRTDVVASEAGGITQHIGAYQVVRKGKPITFIDTPGHEAFTAMRSRGAKVADIAILVVAADDGVMPQTIEAFRIIEAAKVPLVVAINKIDKPDANLDKTKQELASRLNITPEDWGGKTPCVPVSAKEGKGIDELLDTILLIAELDAATIAANPNASAAGTIIESDVDKGAGPVATILVQNGTLRVGDDLILRGQVIGRARALQDFRGETIETAPPSTPAKIVGLKVLPAIGDVVEVGTGERLKGKKYKKDESAPVKIDIEGAAKYNVLIKADVLGSAEAIEESLVKLNSKRIQANILQKGLGNVTEGDLKRAEATGSVILGFNIKVPPAMEELAREKNISIKTYRIIYDLINDVKAAMGTLVKPDTKRVDLGRAKVLVIFRSERTSQIVGAKVTTGKAEKDALVEVVKAGDLAAEGKLTRLQSGKQDVSAVESGQEFGMQYEGRPVVAVGDELIFYRIDKIFDQA